MVYNYVRKKTNTTIIHREAKNTPNDVADIAGVSITQPGHKTILNQQQESALLEYLVKASDIYIGLSPKEVRRLAYDYAKQLQLSLPESWENSKMAGGDWFAKFMKRHPRLSIRKPQATSLASQLTDRPGLDPNEMRELQTEHDGSNLAGTSRNATGMESLNETLESIRPFPKADPRKPSNRGRKRRKTEILTSSPVMKKVAEELKNKEATKDKKNKKSTDEPSTSAAQRQRESKQQEPNNKSQKSDK